MRLKDILSHKLGLASGMIKNEDPKSLTPQQMKEWNMFIDFLEKKGVAGSKNLDKRDKNMGAELFAEFKKSNPNVTIDYSIVKPAQAEFQKLKTSMKAFAERRGDKNDGMGDISDVDGWMGSRTSKQKFPFMVEENYHNDQLKEKKDLGLVTGAFTPTGADKTAAPKKQPPSGKEVVTLPSGNFYRNDDGDLVKLD